jgi:choline dehydrogenase-like flavoprotein
MAEETVDVVVIGRRRRGAPLTSRLVAAGKQVLMLEKGPLLRTQYQDPSGLSDFKRDETFATGTEKRINVPGMANRGDSFFPAMWNPT